MASGSGLVCPLCPQEHTALLGFSLRENLQHINLFHAHQPGFQVICGIGGCARTFCKFRTFENHISLYHRGELHPTNQVTESNSLCSSSRDESIDATSRSEDTNSLELRHSAEDPESLILQRSSAMFLLHMKEGHKLTQAALQGLLEGITSLCQQRLSSIQKAVNTVLTGARISTTSIRGLDDIFYPEGQFGQPFKGLETQHQQLKFFKAQFLFVVC